VITYIITAVVADGETVRTDVTYDIDGTEVAVSVPHFHPKTKEDIITGIKNRAVSEKAKLDASNLNKTLVTDIASEKDKETKIV